MAQRTNLTKNFLKFSPRFAFPRYSQIPEMEATTVLFVEIPDIQLYYDSMFHSLYIVGSCRFRIYFFSGRDFVVPLFHPVFDPSTPYIAFPLHIAHPSPPAAPLAALPLGFPADPLNPESDPSEATGSSSSSGLDDYAPAETGIANDYVTK